MWLIIYVCIINENVCINLKKMCKYIVSGNVDKIYFMSTFPETISYYLKKSFVIYIYIYTVGQKSI